MAAIQSSEILFKYSVKTGSAGNSTASSATNSLGKYISTTEFTAGTNTLYDDISGAENLADTVDYRCVFIHNSNGSNTLVGTKVWVSAETGGGASVAIAIDTTAASALGSASAQALEAATETAPGGSITGLSYSTPTTLAAGLTLGDLTTAAPCRAFWVRRTAAHTTALSNDGCTLSAGGDTGSL